MNLARLARLLSDLIRTAKKSNQGRWVISVEKEKNLHFSEEKYNSPVKRTILGSYQPGLASYVVRTGMCWCLLACISDSVRG